MTSIISVSSYKAGPIRTMSRIVNLVIALGLPVMLVAYPPVKTEWIATGSMLSILLFLFAIVGLWPRLRVSILGHVFNNMILHTTVSFLIGMSVIMMAIYNPPVANTWFAFFSFIGLLLVFDAILSMGYLLKSRSVRRTKGLHMDLRHNPQT